MLYVFITNILSVVVVLGIMILIHELGHFLAAKYFGIRVHVFSFGFGPRLFGFELGGTDYRVSALPLGGYVKMAGENPGDEVQGAPDEFMSKPRWQRFIVAIMGPGMNVALAASANSSTRLRSVMVPVQTSQSPRFAGWLFKKTSSTPLGTTWVFPGGAP